MAGHPRPSHRVRTAMGHTAPVRAVPPRCHQSGGAGDLAPGVVTGRARPPRGQNPAGGTWKKVWGARVRRQRGDLRERTAPWGGGGTRRVSVCAGHGVDRDHAIHSRRDGSCWRSNRHGRRRARVLLWRGGRRQMVAGQARLEALAPSCMMPACGRQDGHMLASPMAAARRSASANAAVAAEGRGYLGLSRELAGQPLEGLSGTLGKLKRWTR